MSVPELTYHAERNSWDLISQLLNSWIRLKLASEWDPSKELPVSTGSKMLVIQIETLTEDYVVLSWGQTEKERKNKIPDKERRQIRSHYFIYVLFTCCKLQQSFRKCLSCHFICETNGSLEHYLVLNSVSCCTDLHCNFMEVIRPICTLVSHL